MIAQLVKNLPSMQKALVQFLGQEDLLEKGQSTHSSILGLPLWLSWLRIHLQCWRPGFDNYPGLVICPGEGKGYPLQYSDLENSMDCIVHGITKSWTWLSNFHFHRQNLIYLYWLIYLLCYYVIFQHMKK